MKQGDAVRVELGQVPPPYIPDTIFRIFNVFYSVLVILVYLRVFWYYIVYNVCIKGCFGTI